MGYIFPEGASALLSSQLGTSSTSSDRETVEGKAVNNIYGSAQNRCTGIFAGYKELDFVDVSLLNGCIHPCLVASNTTMQTYLNPGTGSCLLVFAPRFRTFV